jgi:hypothetical protein
VTSLSGMPQLSQRPIDASSWQGPAHLHAALRSE